MGAIAWLAAIGFFFLSTAIGFWSLSEISRSVVWGLSAFGAVCLFCAFCLEFKRSRERSKFAESEIIALRPHIIADALEIRGFNTDRPMEGFVLLKNTGRTSAIDLERTSQIMFTGFPAEQFPELGWGGAKSSLGPQGEVILGPIPLPRILTPFENEQLTSGRFAIYIFGEIRYADKFGRTYSTKFRSFHRGNGSQPRSGEVLTTQQADSGNEIDK